METTRRTDKQLQQAEPVYLESTLLRVFGVLFCHDPKRARSRTGKVEISRGVVEKGIAVRFDPEYAQPGPFAHKVAMAVIRKQSKFGRPAQKAISFSQRELVRMTGRKTWGGRHSEELALALKQIRYSHVIAHFKKDDRFVEHDFSIFNEVLIERRASHTDPIVACTIVLADPIIQSLNDKHFTCLNHTLMQELSTIGSAFYMRLFYHFATHYDGHRLDRIAFKKRYDGICAEWLGGITVLKHRSKILGEQLGIHLDQLVSLGFLRSYALTPAESRDGFVLTFRPGDRFKADYHTFYTRRSPGEVRFTFDDESRETGDPHRVAYLFMEKHTGRKPDAAAYVSSKEVDTAKELLAQLSMVQIPDFFDYALAEAGKTRFAPQTLGGVRQYLQGYQETLERRRSGKAAAEARRAEERQTQLRLDYDQYRRGEVQRLFDRLPADEQASIEALARAKLSAEGPIAAYMTQTLIRVEKLRLTIERHPGGVADFNQWSASQAA
ncbi:replication initiator protein A [Bradyrhizobium sp.]|uniref:replication initiator protein A n=1 Tax=Bradyrhizobium sp. TaxID=376 RepID=UPI002732800A|nr:replication initiator protein A [Bradyrhizobium sp.]MDP3077957.1 replication initiator protein A [Bradyrhizobium sp.]